MHNQRAHAGTDAWQSKRSLCVTGTWRRPRQTSEGRACLWKASRSSLAGSSPTAPGFSKPLVHWISVPESSVWWSTGKLNPKPSTGRARSAMALRRAEAAL